MPNESFGSYQHPGMVIYTPLHHELLSGWLGNLWLYSCEKSQTCSFLTWLDNLVPTLLLELLAAQQPFLRVVSHTSMIALESCLNDSIAIPTFIHKSFNNRSSSGFGEFETVDSGIPHSYLGNKYRLQEYLQFKSIKYACVYVCLCKCFWLPSIYKQVDALIAEPKHAMRSF